MTDYIKREDAVRRIAVLMAAEAESDGCEDQPMDNYIEYASEDLADIPSADVAPVRHGHWEVIDAEEPRRYGCSECKRLSWHMENYCPNCGAKMDGEEKNCGTCKHYDKRWDDATCDGCTTADSHWERRDDE